MKILLINPPIREWAKPNCFPVGLGYIASVLLSDGHDVEVMDINAHRWNEGEVEERLKKAEFNLVGTGGMITVYKYIKWLTSTIKKHHPQKPVVVGGSVATSIPKTLLERTEADIACIGEGESTIREVVKRLENGETLKGVAGIWYKIGSGEIISNPPRPFIENLDDLPPLAYALFPMDIYVNNVVGVLNVEKWTYGDSFEAKKVRTMNVHGSRGCPYSCSFCYHDFMGSKYRMKSPKRLVHEIKELKEGYELDFMLLQDDLFTANRKVLFEFCDLLIKENIDIKWECSSRVNLVDAEMLAKMKAAGCICVGYGIESGSPEILREMNKKQTVEQAKRALALNKVFFGNNYHTMIIGMPSETLKTIQESIDFCLENDFSPQAVFYATPYPGTQLYEYAREKELIDDEEEFVLSLYEQGETIACNLTHFTDEELRYLKKYMVRRVGAQNIMTHK